MEKLACDFCYGLGYTSEHADHPHTNGDCFGACPIQVECEYCEATGFITGDILLRKEYQRQMINKRKEIDNDLNNLPF